MSDQIKIEHLGGWPRILKEAPVRPHDYMDPESHDESDEPHNIELRLLRKFSDAKNIYAVFSAFIEFHKLGLYPPRWALDHMVACLQKHMNDPQPELFTSRMGVVGPTSGATSPYERFMWHDGQGRALVEMGVLRMAFDISLMDAARAVIEKFDLDVTEKRLTNKFRADGREMKEALSYIKAQGNFNPLQCFWPPTEKTRDQFIDSFPRRAQNIIRKNMPGK